MTSALQIWKLDIDPTDAVSPYTPYDFTSVGRPGIAKGSMTRDFARRESVATIPGMDGVLDGYGRLSGPMDRRDFTVTFTVFTDGHNDAAWDLLMAQVASGVPVRLVYTTDGGGQWFTTASNPKVQNTNSSENRWGGGGEVNFVVTWRIRPYWTPRFSESANVFHSGATFHTGAHFGSAGVTIISANPQAFAIDATGTAGVNLPTIPETGMTVILTGPCGGAGVLRIINFTAPAYDTNGVKQPMYFDVPFNLPTANDSAVLRFGAQAFGATIGGVGRSFRPLKPVDSHGYRYQREWWRIEAGVNNGCNVVALDALGNVDPSPLLGGTIKVDWYRKRA